MSDERRVVHYDQLGGGMATLARTRLLDSIEQARSRVEVAKTVLVVRPAVQ
jgi:hypothetical protein